MTFNLADLWAGFILFVFVVLSLIGLMGLSDNAKRNNALEKCAQQNNVFECEMIAVPKKGQNHE